MGAVSGFTAGKYLHKPNVISEFLNFGNLDISSARMIKSFATVELQKEPKTVTEVIKNTIFKIILTIAND